MHENRPNFIDLIQRFIKLAWKLNNTQNYKKECYAAFRLACRLPHCRFDGNFCANAQAPLATEERPSGEQRQANQLITSPLCPQRQTADSSLLFNLRAMSLGGKAKAAWLLRSASLKWQAVIRRCSGNAMSGRLIWNHFRNIGVHVDMGYDVTFVFKVHSQILITSGTWQPVY